MFQLSDQQTADFHRDGFVVVDGLIGDDTTDRLRDAFERIFSGRFETGIRPETTAVQGSWTTRPWPTRSR